MKTGGREMPLQNGRLPPKTGGLTGLFENVIFDAVELDLDTPFSCCSL